MNRLLVSLLSAFALVFAGFVSPAAAAPQLSDTEITGVVTKVREQLLALSYDSPEIARKISPARFSAIEIINKRLAISRATGRPFPEVTDAEAEQALRSDYVAGAGYAQSYAEVQARLDEFLTQIIASDSQVSGRTAQQYEQLITENRAQLLLGMTYAQRLYDFDYGTLNFAQGLRTSGSFGKTFSPFDLALRLGSQTGDQYAMPKNVDTFNRLIAGVATDANSLDAFITSVVPVAEVKDWYVAQLTEHGNVVSENASPNLPDGTHHLYAKLANSNKLRPYLLPLVSRTNSDMWLISNVSSVSWGMREGYVADKNNAAQMSAFKEQVATAGAGQAAYIDFWARMVPELKHTLKTDRIATDGYFVAGRGTGQQAWSPQVGTNAAEAVLDFFGPMKLWHDYRFMGAEASGSDITFWIARLLAPSGASAYTHELTHQLAQTGSHTYLKGFKNRSGTSAELLPRGLYETYEKNDPIYALNQIMDWPATGYANSNVNLFTDESSVQNYVKNLLDVTNTLDLLEAEDVLARDATVKQKWFNTVSLTPNTAHPGKFDETFAASNPTAAANWNSVNDLVDANAVVSRYEAVGTNRTGTAPYNGYPTIPLFSPLYGAPLASNGSTGDIHMRRIAWELLGEYGYSNGLVPYLSDQYKPANTVAGTAFADAVVLQQISPYGSNAELRKAMFQQRADRLNELKPIVINYGGQTISVPDVSKLRELMHAAVDADVADTRMGVRSAQTHVEQLKSAVYLAYKAATGEFQTSIYKAAKTYQVSYSFAGVAPADVTAPVDVTEYASGTAITLPVPVSAASEHNGIDGGWAFNGWQLKGADGQVTEATFTDSDLEFIGTWSFTPNKYSVSYQVMGDVAPANTPATPVDSARYMTGDVAQVQPALQTTETSHNGIPGSWAFNGWLHNGSVVTEIEINRADLVLTGSWIFTPNDQFSVSYVYKTAANNPALPAALVAPNPVSAYAGQSVSSPEAPADYRDSVNRGTWKFASWDQTSVTLTSGNVTVSGLWEFVADPVDTTRIEQAINAGRAALASVHISTDGSDVDPVNKWVTQAEADAFTAQLHSAQLKLDMNNLTFDAAETLYQQLVTAGANFAAVHKAGTKQSTLPDTPPVPTDPGDSTGTQQPTTPIAPTTPDTPSQLTPNTEAPTPAEAPAPAEAQTPALNKKLAVTGGTASNTPNVSVMFTLLATGAALLLFAKRRQAKR